MTTRSRVCLCLLILPLLSACPSTDIGSAGGTTGSGGGGGSAPTMTLGASGAIGDTCAPNDGAALDVVIGGGSDCNVAPDSNPQIHFFAYPGGTKTLAAGQSWSFDATTVGQQLQASFFPDGVGGNDSFAKTGSLSVVSVSGSTAVVQYAFTMPDGTSYGGKVTVNVCPSTPTCG